MVSVTYENVSKSFGRTEAVRGVDLTVAAGELFFLLGPSGCGKTTCLRMAAGFERPDAGRLLFDNRDVSRVPPHRRNAGMVFQSYALFPHINVARNVAYGLRMRGVGAAERERRTTEALRHTRIEDLAGRMPSQLSGGQQQRVALARALVIEPDVLLLDEPLSNLDAALRMQMRDEIRRIHSELGITTIYVTHDQEEALSLAGRVAVLRDGRIEQIGAPRDIYFTPRNAFVAAFVGKTNLLRGRVTESHSDFIVIETAAGPVRAANRLPESKQRGSRGEPSARVRARARRRARERRSRMARARGRHHIPRRRVQRAAGHGNRRRRTALARTIRFRRHPHARRPRVRLLPRKGRGRA